MKILFIAPYLPSSIRSRSYNFIKGLYNNDHSVYFAGTEDEYAALEIKSALQSYCDKIELFQAPRAKSYFNSALALFRNQALQTAYVYSRKLKNRIEEILSRHKFDIIHVEHIRAGSYLPASRCFPAVFDSVDCITSLYRQFAAENKPGLKKILTMLEYHKLKKYEPSVLSRFDGILVTTDKDKVSLERSAPAQGHDIPEIKVIQNGVDFEYFKPVNGKINPYTIVFSGKMGYYANELAAVHFARDIFPLIKAKIAAAKFYIVGANPSKRLKRMGDGKNIIVTGWVPEIKEYLDSAQVVVCPVRVSVGIQNKLLEAMSMSKAIVTYPEVTGPLLNSNGKNVFLTANTAAVFAEKTLNIFKDDSLRKSLGDNARSYIKKYYGWDKKIEELENLYKQVSC